MCPATSRRRPHGSWPRRFTPDAELRLVDVGLNPTRTALIDVLRSMGAQITIDVRETREGEPVGDIDVRGGRRLQAISLGASDVAPLIDELPLIAVAMAAADGTSEVRGAARAARQGVGSDRGDRRGADGGRCEVRGARGRLANSARKAARRARRDARRSPHRDGAGRRRVVGRRARASSWTIRTAWPSPIRRSGPTRNLIGAKS